MERLVGKTLTFFMDGGQSRTVTETFRNYYDTIFNYFVNRSTNAIAKSRSFDAYTTAVASALNN